MQFLLLKNLASKKMLINNLTLINLMLNTLNYFKVIWELLIGNL